MPIGMTSIMETDNEENLRRVLHMIQCMIDISADRLEGLRTQCNASAELTQQEIRTLEAKLVKMFSELLTTKAKLPDHMPKVPTNATEVKQWLRVVGECHGCYPIASPCTTPYNTVSSLSLPSSSSTVAVVTFLLCAIHIFMLKNLRSSHQPCRVPPVSS